MNDIQINERDDIEAIIGNPPGWTMRWGMTFLLGLFLLLASVAWMVRYPDIVEAPAVLTTQKPPIRVVSKTSARLVELRAENGKEVNQNDILGLMENPAELNDVIELKQFLNNLEENKTLNLSSAQIPNELKIGSLESTFALFEKSFSELKYFLSQDINYLKIENLQKQILELERLNRSLNRQAKFLNQEVEVAYSGFQRDSILLTQKSLSELEFEATKMIWIRKKRELENLKSGTVENDLNIRKMEAQILDLQQLRNDGESEKVLNFETELEKLKGEIEIWENTYLIKAPINGKVSLTNKWSAQQFVNAGEEILTVIPDTQSNEIFGRLLLSGPNMGKVEPGMTVLLRLDGFPYQEYGVLESTLENIAEAPGQEGYEAQISLSKNMVTTHDRLIPFRQEMKATARIITEERSYLDRILENFWATFEKN